MIRWQLMLDQLLQEGKTLLPEQSRPFALARIADTYWIIDRDKAEEVFIMALETAISLKSDATDSSSAIRNVLSLAARNDASLAKRLIDRLQDARSKENEKGTEPLQVAIDLLSFDAQRAAEMARASAPIGLSDDSAGFFILKLAQSDLSAAESVYRAYLTRFVSSSDADLGSLLWLAGFPFGYGESYGFMAGNPYRMNGIGGMRIQGLISNPNLAAAFLDSALPFIQKAIAEASSSTPEKDDRLAYLALFATTYLLPEVARYRSGAFQVWRELNQQALSATSVARQQEVMNQIQRVLQNRSRANENDRSPQSHIEQQIESYLQEAENSVGCNKDRLYAKAALSICYKKDFAQALAIATKIDTTSLKESVRQYINYSMSAYAVESKNFDDARVYAERVESPEQRSLLYVKIARAALRDKDRVFATQSLIEARKLAEHVSDPKAQAGILLTTSTAFSSLDPIETFNTLKDSIKAVNRTKNLDIDSFRVLRRVNLSCSGEDYTWYGGYDQPEEISLTKTLGSYSESDIEGAILMAQTLEDPEIRIRVLTSIIKRDIQKAERTS